MTEHTHILRRPCFLEHNQKMRHKTKVDKIGQKLAQLDESRSYPDVKSCEKVWSLVDDKSGSYPDIESCEEVRSLVDDVGELVGERG